MTRDLVLVVTNRRDLTADFLVIGLREMGTRYSRLNTEDIPSRVSLSYDPTARDGLAHVESEYQQIRFEEVRSVLYRRPSLPVISPDIEDQGERELAEAETIAAIEALWEILDCYWVSKPHSLRIAEHKPLQLATAERLGFDVPDTLVTNCISSAESFLSHHPEVICKPLKVGSVSMGSGSRSLIYTSRLENLDCDELASIRLAPVLLQEHVPKLQDIRVTVMGTQIFSVAIDSQSRPETLIDWRHGDAWRLQHSVHALPCSVKSLCRGIVRELDLEFGAIDLIQRPDGGYTFLEINPNGQWAWLQQLLPELRLREALAEMLSNGRS